MNRKQLGDLGEKVAEQVMRAKGFHILKRKYKIPRIGEVDLIAEDRFIRTFVEVKLSRFGAPEEHIIPAKIATIRRVAEFYQQKHPTKKKVRFDVVLVTLESDGLLRGVRWVENAF